MSADHLAPRSIGALLDAGFRLFTRHPLQLMLASVIAGVPALLAVLVSEQPFVLFAAAILGGLVGIVVSLGIIRLAHETVLGRDPQLPDCIREGGRRLVLAVVANVLVVALSMAPYLLMAVVAFSESLALLAALVAVPASLIIAIYLSFVMQVVAVEGLGAGALGRSLELVRGHFWRVLGVFAVFWLLGVVLTLALGATQAVVGGGEDAVAVNPDPWSAVLSQYTVSSLAGALAGLITSAILTPVQTLVMTLLYIDVRVRKEGYDVEVLTADLDAPAA